jgi:hypothetical protein
MTSEPTPDAVLATLARQIQSLLDAYPGQGDLVLPRAWLATWLDQLNAARLLLDDPLNHAQGWALAGGGVVGVLAGYGLCLLAH